MLERSRLQDSRLEPKKDAKLSSDYQLVRQILAGDEDASRTLLTMLYRRVNARVRYLCHNDTEAEDLTQDTLVQILESLRSFRADGCLEAWADVIAVRTVIRTMVRVRRTRWLFGGSAEPVSALSNPEQAVNDRARSGRLYALMSRIPSEWREVVILKLMYGYSAKEVAEMTGKSLKVVQYHIKRGRAELRRLVLKDVELREMFAEVVL